MVAAASPAQIRVSEQALIQRINRKLAPELQQLKKSRGEYPSRGDFWILDCNRNFVVADHVDIEELARELGCLATWEKLDDSDN